MVGSGMTDETDEALIDRIANLFVPNRGSKSDDEVAELAYQAGEIFGHGQGWTTPTIKDYAAKVKRRVVHRLWVLSRQSASSG